jgi:hypothetical protein
MARPATPEDIERILDRLKRLPRLGRPLRTRSISRARLRKTGAGLVAKLDAPRSEVESHLRWMLRRAAVMD